MNLFRLMVATLFLAGILVGTSVLAEDEKGPKVTELKPIETTSAKLAQEFAKDNAKALTTYTPQKAKQGAEGTYVRISGKVIRDQPGGAIEIEGDGDWKVLAKGRMEGTGDVATITVESVGVGNKLIVLYGTIKRTAKTPQ